MVSDDVQSYPTRNGRRGIRVGMGDHAPVRQRSCSIRDVSHEEAAAITVPVFVGVGRARRVPGPARRAGTYAQSPDITVFVCPRMSHMHNFAGTTASCSGTASTPGAKAWPDSA